MEDNIKVFARLRPAVGAAGNAVLKTVGNTAVQVTQGEEELRQFSYDAVFGQDATQEMIFDACGKPLVAEVLKGFNCTVFAYGQTGSGKSYTIFGPEEEEEEEGDGESEEQSGTGENMTTEKTPPKHESIGLLPRMLQKLFASIRTLEGKREFLCKGGLVEIYNEKIHDLLDDGQSENLQLRESMKKGVFVENQTQIVFENEHEALETVRRGARGRKIGETAMNRESSRSHTVFTLILESKFSDDDNVVISRTARLNIVDLAGSERQKLTKATGQRQKEANFINRSLLCLGSVISSLAAISDANSRENSSCLRPHIKYRDSKLTFLLRDSLGGNSKTAMIATINPLAQFFGESLSTLKFAQRAKLIRNKATVNEDLASSDVAALRSQILNLKQQLASFQKLERGELVTTRHHGLMFNPKIEETQERNQASDQIERLEQLLSHSLGISETARERADQFKNLAENKGEACRKLSKALQSQKALFKLKNGQVLHLMKEKKKKNESGNENEGEKEDSQLIREWMQQEKNLWDDLKNVQAIEWRTKFEELKQQMETDQEKLEISEEREIMNRKLSEEIRNLLESKRELQDLLTQQKQAAIRSRHSLDVELPKTPSSTSKKTFSPNKTPIKTPARIPLLPQTPQTSSKRVGPCPTPSKEDFDRFQLDLQRKKYEEKIRLLEQQLENCSTEKMRQLDQELNDQKAQNEKLQKEMKKLETDLAMTTEENIALQESEKRANEAKEYVEQRLDVLNEQAMETERLKEDLDNLIAQNSLNVAHLEVVKKESKESLEKLQAELDQAKTTIAQFEESQKEQTEANAEQEEQHQQLRDEIQSLTKFREAQQQTDSLRIANLKRQIEEQQRQIEDQKETLKQDSIRIANLNNQVVELNHKVKKGEVSTKELQQLVSEYRKTLQNERNQRKELESERTERAEIEALLESERMEADMVRLNLTQAKAELLRLHEVQESRERDLMSKIAQAEKQAKETEKSQPVSSHVQDQLELERALRTEAENKVMHLEAKVEELAISNAKLAGNKNHRQRIKYVESLKDQIRELEASQELLRKRVSDMQTQKRVGNTVEKKALGDVTNNQ